MEKKAVSEIMLTVLLVSLMTLALNIQPVKASGRIIIRSDGSVEGTDKIQRDGDVYTFMDSIYQEIYVRRSNIIIDGAGYELQGPASDQYYGFATSEINNVTIKNTNIIGFEYCGIFLGGSSFCNISGNNIKNARARTSYGGYGIWLIENSNYNTISENNIANNGRAAISIWGSHYNTISGNNIINNRVCGIHLFAALSNKIYHNNFIDNIDQVYPAPGYPNIWYDDYPSGGNYWSDYSVRYPSVKDEYQGENQDVPDSDEIWDSPFEIDYTNKDRYPLVNPWESTPPVADAGADQTVYEGTSVTFDGSGSYDNVGIVSYVWTFTDVTPQTLTDVYPTYTFITPGIYIVTLDVRDAARNHATDTVTITVLRLTPKDLTQRLIETIEAWNLPKGTESSLTSKLEDALHLLDIGNENGAIHKLMDFINQAEALRGTKLTNEQADYVTGETQRTIDLIKG